MEATLYSQEGKKKGSIKLSEVVFGARWNADLVHQVVTSMRSSARAGTAHTKNRGDVRGGGKKPWQQKGTGRARHGSIRSPLWRGGGSTFGPRADKNYERSINKKMKVRALYATLSRKLKDGEIFFIDSFVFPERKTKRAKETLIALSSAPGLERVAGKGKSSTLIVLPKRDEAVQKSFRNFGNILVTEARNLNPVEVLNHRFVLVVDPAESEKMIPHIS